MNEDVAAASEGGDGAATALLSSYLPSHPDGVRLKFRDFEMSTGVSVQIHGFIAHWLHILSILELCTCMALGIVHFIRCNNLFLYS